MSDLLLDWMGISRVAAHHEAAAPFAGKHLLVATHAKKATAAMLEACRRLGATVTFHPVGFSIDDAIVRRIRDELEVTIVSRDDLMEVCQQVDVILEDSASVGRIASGDGVANLKPNLFSVEQTTSGIRYYQQLTRPLRYPVLNVAESAVKMEVECAHATPLSIISNLLNSMNISIAGKEILILGYGQIGQGLARLCRDLGGHVTVCEILAVRRLVAEVQGFQTTESPHSVLHKQHIVFTCTSDPAGSSIGPEEICLMRDCAIVVNAGSGTGELAPELRAPGELERHRGTLSIAEHDEHLLCVVRKQSREKHIVILAHGYPVNLRLGHGTPAEVIDVIFALMLHCAARSMTADLPKKVVELTSESEEEVARIVSDPRTPRRPTLIRGAELESGSRPFGEVAPVTDGGVFLSSCSLARARFRAGKSTDGHFHLRSEEAYMVESGTASIEVWKHDDPEARTVFELAPGDFLSIPPGFAHVVHAGSEADFVAVVVASPPFSFWDQYFPGVSSKTSADRT